MAATDQGVTYASRELTKAHPTVQCCDAELLFREERLLCLAGAGGRGTGAFGHAADTGSTVRRLEADRGGPDLEYRACVLGSCGLVGANTRCPMTFMNVHRCVRITRGAVSRAVGSALPIRGTAPTSEG